jgi:hypothetical protein
MGETPGKHVYTKTNNNVAYVGFVVQFHDEDSIYQIKEN